MWEFRMLPKPWNNKEWGYVITLALWDIVVREELFAQYYVN